ncbi:MAG: protein translocase subunit SecD, partial [Chromatiales bacterium]
MNQYPLWKNILVLLVVLVGSLYALPNLYDQDPSMEISGTRRADVSEDTVKRVTEALQQAGIEAKGVTLRDAKILIRFKSSEDQLKAQDVIEKALGYDYNQALTLAPDLPDWLRSLGAEPMYLGLDLRGGIYVLIDVDMDAAVAQAIERYTDDIRTLLRNEKVRYLQVSNEGNAVLVKFKDQAKRDRAEQLIYKEFRNLKIEPVDEANAYYVKAILSPNEIREVKKFALNQNITTLRNRVNALGVAEPSIQQQGDRRIVVQLPGAQDPAKLKEMLGATATLEYRLVDTEHSVEDAVNGRVPPGSKLYRERDGQPVLLKKRVIVTGNQITDASSGLDQRTGQPAVFVSLDGVGAKRMRRM